MMKFKSALTEFPPQLFDTATRLPVGPRWDLQPTEVVKVRVNGNADRKIVYVHAEALHVGRTVYFLFLNARAVDVTESFLAANTGGYIKFKAASPGVLRALIQQHHAWQVADRQRANFLRKIPNA